MRHFILTIAIPADQLDDPDCKFTAEEMRQFLTENAQNGEDLDLGTNIGPVWITDLTLTEEDRPLRPYADAQAAR